MLSRQIPIVKDIFLGGWDRRSKWKPTNFRASRRYQYVSFHRVWFARRSSTYAWGKHISRHNAWLCLKCSRLGPTAFPPVLTVSIHLYYLNSSSSCPREFKSNVNFRIYSDVLVESFQRAHCNADSLYHGTSPHTRYCHIYVVLDAHRCFPSLYGTPSIKSESLLWWLAYSPSYYTSIHDVLSRHAYQQSEIKIWIRNYKLSATACFASAIWSEWPSHVHPSGNEQPQAYS